MMVGAQYPQEKVDRIRARFGEWLESVELECSDVPVLWVPAKNLISFLESIRKEEGFEYNFLADLTAYDDNPPLDQIADYGLGTVTQGKPGAERFVVVYQLLSMQNKDRIRIKVRVAEDKEAPSIVSLWESANWLEREVFDMYGIKFSNHPNLRRILLDDRWVGHPQRKDYPIKRYQRFEGSLPLDKFDLE